jgi:small-conductance mechanosensitive channel
MFMALHGVCPGDDACRSLINELEQKTTRLSEYVSALQNAHRMRDVRLMQALNGQIDQILSEIRAAETTLKECPSKLDVLMPPLAPVKSEENEFANLSCDDLRKKHIQLARKINALARRSESVLTEMTPEQKAEYTETRELLAKVEKMLTTKCTSPEPRSAIRRRRP